MIIARFRQVLLDGIEREEGASPLDAHTKVRRDVKDAAAMPGPFS